MKSILIVAILAWTGVLSALTAPELFGIFGQAIAKLTWDIPNAMYDSEWQPAYVPGEYGTARYGISSNGMHIRMISASSGNPYMYQAGLTTPFDFTTATTLVAGPIVTLPSAYGTGQSNVWVDDSGDHCYVATAGCRLIGMDTSPYFGGVCDSPEYLCMSSDGWHVYIGGTGAAGQAIYQFSLSYEWGVSTLTYDNVYMAGKHKVFFKSSTEAYVDGKKYTLSTAWDLSTATQITFAGSITPCAANANGTVFLTSGTQITKYIVP